MLDLSNPTHLVTLIICVVILLATAIYVWRSIIAISEAERENERQREQTGFHRAFRAAPRVEGEEHDPVLGAVVRRAARDGEASAVTDSQGRTTFHGPSQTTRRPYPPTRSERGARSYPAYASRTTADRALRRRPHEVERDAPDVVAGSLEEIAHLAALDQQDLAGLKRSLATEAREEERMPFETSATATTANPVDPRMAAAFQEAETRSRAANEQIEAERAEAAAPKTPERFYVPGPPAPPAPPEPVRVEHAEISRPSWDSPSVAAETHSSSYSSDSGSSGGGYDSGSSSSSDGGATGDSGGGGGDGGGSSE